MPSLTKQSLIRLFITTLVILSLTGCEYMQNLVGGDETENNNNNVNNNPKELVSLSLAVAPYIAWMPWYLANEEGAFQEYRDKYNVDVQFVTGDYSSTIRKFINREVHAVAISNIDAIANFVREDIEADVILVMGYSNGNETLLVNGDAEHFDLRDKEIALSQNTSRHYLLERYMIKNQIDFDRVNIQNTRDIDIPTMFVSGEVYGVVAGNPNSAKLINEQQAQLMFDSRRIPNEIMYLLVARREVLQENPQFSQALLSAWFSVVERLQGSRKGSTIRAMSQLASIEPEDFANQLSSVELNDTPIKSLSAIRNDRLMRQAMRHIRYFAERHELIGSEPFTSWVSYPGRTPALVHFNSKPLQSYVTKAK
ncbi:ABC transporter substrate-binding protein [Candidatus Albibeggiatoa sp. nov. BB20]|uniref:ABC transporter substrate-binding protein n=1 Tax=Candidatus Albibeggiatoa sp. nov. BB20 TaxID=3162723 RepID=UPI0033659FB3